MTNEVVPGEASSWSDVLQELNIPKLVLGPAGESLSRLVGHVADVPSEYVKSFTQSIKDKREARTEISKALANAVASEVRTDRDLIHRAAQSFLAKELRSQTNKEAVAKKTVEHLADDAELSSTTPETPDDDWLNMFERYAENASSEKIRDLWGRILAGQIRKPKSFSLSTMRFVSELDAETASLFEKYSVGVINKNYMLKPQPLEGSVFTELLALEDAGILTGVDGNIGQTIKQQRPETFSFSFRRNAVLAEFIGPVDFVLPTIMLTRVGKELLNIVDPADDLEAAISLAGKIPRANLKHVKYGRLNEARNLIQNPITAWPPTPGS